MTSHGMEHDHPPHGHPHPPIGVHGMALVGQAPTYLSHLPMFMAPHNYQALLQVALDDEVRRGLADYRAHFGPDVLFSVKPEVFSIVDLLPDAAGTALATFEADVFFGHFERGGDVIAEGSTVRVDDVVHFQELGAADKAADLEYILFGTEQQFFLAHRITQPPDFDQLLTATVTGHQFTADELHREHFGVLVTIPGRANTPHERLKAGEKVSGRGHVAGAHQFLDLEVEALAEIYFEEGELRVPPTFAPTEEERAAGFGGE